MTVRWVRAEQVLWRRTFDGAALLPAGADEPLMLDGPGAALWELLEEPIGVEEAAGILAETYGVAPAVVSRDIAPVLDRLARLGAAREVA